MWTHFYANGNGRVRGYTLTDCETCSRQIAAPNTITLREKPARLSDKVRNAIEQVAEFFGMHVEDLAGYTLRDWFEDAERVGATVYWGCWSDAELDQRL